MRLLSLDYDPVYGNQTTRALFKSDVSCFDYDIVIWDPAASLQTYFRKYLSYFRGLPCLAEHESVSIKADAVRRNAEFVEFVESGRTLVVMVRPPQECYIDTGKRTYSGTGRNEKTTTYYTEFSLLTAMPIADCKFIRSSGTNIEFIGSGPIPELLKKYKGHIAYRAYLPSKPGEPLARVPGTDRVVGSVLRSKGGGTLILLPHLEFAGLVDDEHQDKELDEDLDEEDEEDGDGDGDEENWLPEAETFEQDLCGAITSLSSTKSLAWPPWADRYLTEEQQQLRTDVVEQQKQIEAARDKLAEIERLKDGAESKNQLFLGSGRALELEVKSVMELLGGIVTEPKPGRDDWKVAFPKGNAVLEVKGVAKSAAEKHAAQLEKWVAGELEDTGKAPKGLLIVNTWRELPLDERTQDDFPGQMLPYCESRKHCLITGVQLFVIRADVEKNRKRAAHWRRMLLETSGQIKGCNDWRSIIKASQPGESEPSVEEARTIDE